MDDFSKPGIIIVKGNIKVAKAKKSVFFCQNCGHEESKWLGQCPACGEWNSFVEEKIDSGITKGISSGARSVRESVREAKVVPLNSVSADDDARVRTGIRELDRVLGGGIVPGSLVLVGGDPGIGKSTLLLQVCRLLAGEKKVLYISGEESQAQIKLRANRMGEFSSNLYLLCETNLEIIRGVIEKERPELVVIDSIQTMYSEEVSSAPGSVSQVRESTNVFLQRVVYPDLYRRPCDERGNGRRSESVGTYGGYGAVFRGGPACVLPDPPGGEEPFRVDQ